MAELLAPNGQPSNLTPEQYKIVRSPEFKAWFGDWEKLALTKINDSGIDEISLKRLEDGVSKVVDKNGEPLPVYHGTKNNFNKFSLEYTSQNTDSSGFLGRGFYFATNKKDAENYGEVVKPYFLKSIKKIDLRNIEYKELSFLLPNLTMKNGKKWKDAFIEIDNIKSKIKSIEIEDLKNGFFNVHYYYNGNWSMIPRRTIHEIESDGGLNLITERLIDENPNNIGALGNYFNPFILSEEIKKEGFDSVISDGTNIFDLGEEIVVFESNQIKLADGTNTTFDPNNEDIRFEDGGIIEENMKKLELQKLNEESQKNKINDLLTKAQIPYQYTISHKNGSSYWTINSRPYRVADHDKPKSMDVFERYKYGVNDFRSYKQFIDFIENNFDLTDLSKLEKKYKEDVKQNIKINSDGIYVTPDRGTWGDIDSALRYLWRYQLEKRNIYKKSSYLYELEEEERNSGYYSDGGRTIAQTPAPKKDQIKGSDKNKEGSSKDLKSAKKIELSDSTIEAIKNKVDKHNEKHPKKKITIDSAKAVVRRGMGAYSSSHRPTIKCGKPNSRVAWGLARLNAFFYKIINGKSKSGKYSQDNDLIEELGYMVQKYADGGDIQAYKKAMDISEYAYGGEAKPKKVYVSIRLDNQIERDFPNYFWKYDEKTFEELQNGKLLGLVGVSTSPNNIAEWFIHRDCLIVMNYDEFMAINETETINYYDPYQLMKNDLYLFRRLYANVTRYGEQDNSINQTIVKLCEKILPEINLEMNISSGQKYSELYRISRFLDPYQTGAFTRWIEDNKMKIESPIDLTNAILDFNKLYDGYLASGYENPVLTFDELLPIVEKGITNASKIYESEHEIVLINRELNIPKKSQLFFIAKDEVGQNRDSNKDELIQKYNLKELYKVYFVDRQQIQKYRDFWVKKEEEKFKNIIEKGREDLELKKEQVLDELLNYFLEKSISYIKNELEKEIIEYNESLDFYDETDDNSIEQNLFSIPLVVSIMNTYELIIKNFWKSFIQKKEVKNLGIYAFDMFYFNVESELKRYFENNKDELEKLNNYRNTRGSGSLDPYKFERLLLKTINDYEKLPELVDYKELAKMYLDKMGTEIYRYYDENDLKLVSQYKDGGETDEPTHFWGTEAGGVLVYCSTTERYLILLRSMGVSEPNTWGMVSGKLDKEDKSIKEAVFRETEEEIGYKLTDLIPTYIFEKPNFKFHNFLSIVSEEFEPKLNWENSDYKWVKLNDMPENLHFGLKKLIENEDIFKLVEKNKNNNMNTNNPKDTITMDVPLLIRFAELMREDVKTDVQLHEVIENTIDLRNKGVLTMDDYSTIVGNVVSQDEEKMVYGGKVESINSKKGNIKLSLDEYMYSDDTDVELVPVSELVKFREFDRKKNPKYNKENSIDNINHLKFMFQKEGVKSPIIIEYSPEDNAVLIIEGNHRLNSAEDLGMEYLPARVVLKKYGKYSPEKLKNTIKVSGVKGDEYGYISSNMKPSKIGVQGTKSLVFGDGGIIEGRLHSECGEDGCGRKFQVGENGHVIEAERDEAVIVADAFNDNQEYKIEGTPSEIASALNVMGGGKNFDKGANIEKDGEEIKLPEMQIEAIDTDVDDIIDPSSIIINRRSMADEKEYEVTGTPKQIASAINSINGNGVVIEKGAEIKES